MLTRTPKPGLMELVFMPLPHVPFLPSSSSLCVRYHRSGWPVGHGCTRFRFAAREQGSEVLVSPPQDFPGPTQAPWLLLKLSLNSPGLSAKAPPRRPSLYCRGD